MRSLLFCAFGLLISAAPAVTPSSSKIAGDYVEVRTASVFTGACHYNGELVTTGNDALAAWNFQSGQWNGVDLSGVRAVAAITSTANLGLDSGERKAELIVDSSASKAQVAAVADLLQTRSAKQLGQIVSVRQAAITFSHDSTDYVVKAQGVANLTVRPMPNNECCKQPHLVWYTPLAPVAKRKVGYTEHAAYTAGTVGDSWQREGENSAFYGAFSF